jgi:integrase
VRIKLKGINKVTKRLADGRKVTYYYAWKGGPRLDGKPGTPEFVASYNSAISTKVKPSCERLSWVFDAYENSSDFKNLAERTRKDYRKHLRAISAEYGDFPVAALSDRRTRGEFLAWRDRLASSSRRGADYRFSVFARTLSWAADRGLTTTNPLERPGRLYRSKRVDSVWTDADEANFISKAPSHLHLALLLALWTGQRQGDLLRLTWNAYDGAWIKFHQSKTGARIKIRVGAPLKAALDAEIDRRQTLSAKRGTDAVTILITENGTPWTESGFRASWRKACIKAGISDVTFHDLRGTAVTRLAMAECTEAEIAAITGHSLRDVGAILDAHYLKRDPKLAESAIRKLETRTKVPTEHPTVTTASRAS